MPTASPAGLSVVRLPLEAAQAAGTLLARAFQDDPIKVALVPDDARRERFNSGMFATVIVSGLASGGLLTGTSDGGGAALWMPPGVTVRPSAALRSFLAIPTATLRTPPSAMRAGMALEKQLNRRRRVLMPAPHWYLALLGIVPARQGRGLGSLLVRDGLQRADRDGAAAYVETETERNVHFYRSVGFTVLEQIAVTSLDGLPMWLMVREPAAHSAP